MKVSVALCTYNGEAYLAEQLESISNQTRLPDELIICDDRSQDRTLDIINQFQAVAPFPVEVIVNETTLRCTKNFESAILRCTGDVIFLSDQDDVWRKDKVEVITSVFEADADVGVIFTDADIVGRSLQYLGYGLWKSKKFTRAERGKFSSPRGANNVLLKHNVVTGATMAFRRSLVPDIMPIPAIWIHDGWIALIASAVSSVRCLEDRLTLYRQHGGNQIGGVRTTSLQRALGTLRRKLGGGTETHRDMCARRELEYQQYSAGLTQMKMLVDQGKVIGELSPITKKLEHTKMRLDMHKTPTGRFWRALGELLALRYHHFSEGFEGFLIDILPRRP